MRAVGTAAAEEALAARAAAGATFGMPSSNTITQLLMTYVAYDARADAAASDSTDYKASLAAARSEKDDVKTVELLLRRANTATYAKRYDAARKDVELATASFDRAADKAAFPDPLIADLKRASGLYKHLVHDLEGATACYAEALALETTPSGRVETRVKAAGVRVDARSVRAFVDRVLEVEREAAGHAPIGAVERSLHHNVCTIVVNLAADAASTFRLGCFGHELKMDVAPTDALDAIDEENLRTRRRKHSRLFDEARVDALVARPSGIETRPLVAAGGGGSRPRRGGAGHVDIPRADGRPTDRAKLTNLAVAVSFKTATPTA